MAVGSDQDQHVGLVGGSIQRRIATSRIPPIAHDWVLAPYRRPDDMSAFTSFVASAPLEVEVGFGRSHHLLDLARQDPDRNVLGFEIRRQWVRQAAKGATRAELSNVRVVEGDARPFLEALIAPESVSCVHILFPDPWWKRRHHKRRVFSRPWLDLIHRILAPGGSLIAKTDVPAYADLMVSSVSDHVGFQLTGTHAGDPLLGRVPRSHREKKCADHNIPVYAFRYLKETTR
ncbi:MAG: tRNA (guanosine(46)-N7)-methyltransferase TrmB [Myxococcota bacterium]